MEQRIISEFNKYVYPRFPKISCLGKSLAVVISMPYIS
jgi:hypothetical protein